MSILSWYECVLCNKKNCKLWRYFNNDLNTQLLYCFECSCRLTDRRMTPTRDNKAMYSGIVTYWYKPEGSYDFCSYLPATFTPPKGAETFYERDITVCIDFLVPALPTEKKGVYWHYTSAPISSKYWWECLNF